MVQGRGSTMRRLFPVMVTALVLLGMPAVVATPAGAVTRSQLKVKLLSLSNLPAGWRAENPSGGSDTYTGCLRNLHSSPRSSVIADAFYVDGDSAPAVGEALADGSEAMRRYHVLNKVLSAVRSSAARKVVRR